MAGFSGLVRTELQASITPASNLVLNEHIQQLQAAGRHVHHFGFGQSPFPVFPPLSKALAHYSDRAAYLPVAGKVTLTKPMYMCILPSTNTYLRLVSLLASSSFITVV